MIVGIRSLTLKCLARVFSLKSFLTPYNFVGNEGLYNVGKGMGKGTLKKLQAKSFAGHLRLGLSHEGTGEI